MPAFPADHGLRRRGCDLGRFDLEEVQHAVREDVIDDDDLAAGGHRGDVGDLVARRVVEVPGREVGVERRGAVGGRCQRRRPGRHRDRDEHGGVETPVAVAIGIGDLVGAARGERDGIGDVGDAVAVEVARGHARSDRAQGTQAELAEDPLGAQRRRLDRTRRRHLADAVAGLRHEAGEGVIALGVRRGPLGVRA